MALTGNERLEVVPIQTNGNLSPTTETVTTGMIAALANGSGSTTLVASQVIIATTGTAIPVSSSTQNLINGIVLTAGANNAAISYTTGGVGGTVGAVGVLNKTDGTGNGQIMAPGSSTGIGGGIALNTIYVNGVAGDIFSFIGN